MLHPRRLRRRLTVTAFSAILLTVMSCMQAPDALVGPRAEFAVTDPSQAARV